MASNLETIIRHNYNKKLKNERATKGLFNLIYVPKAQKSIKLLPISNLFYGSDEFPPRLKLLLEHINIVNDMPDGAFFFGGNLFYYPPGNTEQKEDLSKIYIEHLSKVFRKVDKNKIILMYDGVNETKFKDDRKLKHSIETTRVLAENLGITKKYYADTKVELNFVFNNELTEYTDQFMYGLFTSPRPISITKNAIMNKIKNNFLLNGNKTFVVDTSSSQLVSKKKIITVPESPTISIYKDITWLSVPGYTDYPQIVKKDNLYTVSSKLIELKIERKNMALSQQSIRQDNTIKTDEWDKRADFITIGVNYERYFDPELWESLNKEILKNLAIEESLNEDIHKKVSQNIEKANIRFLESIYTKSEKNELNQNTEEKKEDSSYRFE